MDIPSNNEEPLKKCRVLYMGTALFNNNLENFDEKNINLNILQDTIAERYPVDGSNFAKGFYFLNMNRLLLHHSHIFYRVFLRILKI